jgi:hypothetical protein
MAFDKPERFLGRVHGRQAFLRSPRIMTASRAPHLTVLAVVGCARPEPDTGPSSRSAEINSKGIAGNGMPIVHTASAFNPTAPRSYPNKTA